MTRRVESVPASACLEGSLSSPSGLGLFAKALPFPAKQAKARMHGQVEREGFDVSAQKIAQSLFQMPSRFVFCLCCNA
jgi:hypothetical protein